MKTGISKGLCTVKSSLHKIVAPVFSTLNVFTDFIGLVSKRRRFDSSVKQTSAKIQL